MPELEWLVEPPPTPVDMEPVAPAGPVEPVLTFRDAIREKSPPWLQRGRAEAILYSIAIHLDGLIDATVAAVRMRFPGSYSSESLPLIGRERRIRRGRNETDAVYASRLRRWLDDHPHRGGPYALLAQLHAHFAPNNFPIDLVYASGRRFKMDVDGNVTRDDAWSLNAPKWARWTLYYFWPGSAESDGIWDHAGDWSDGGVWDSTLTPQEVTDLRLVPREWNAAHCFGEIVLFTGDVELWDYPAGTWDEPDGVWGDVATDIPVKLSIS